MNDGWFKQLAAPFPTEQISWRPGATNKDKTSALGLAYIDARDVMQRLDDVVGHENWQCRYTHCGTATVCEIGIRSVSEGDWVWKADGGGDSDIEAEKGALSGAFKRAAVRWGIGRYLYGLGAVWAPINEWKQFTSDGQDKLSRSHEDFIRKMEWGGEIEGPIVGQIVRFLSGVIAETVKTKADAMEFAAKNDGLLKTLPDVAQKKVNAALRPLMDGE